MVSFALDGHRMGTKIKTSIVHLTTEGTYADPQKAEKGAKREKEILFWGRFLEFKSRKQLHHLPR